MKKRKIYIFNQMSRAAVYGIGTYIEQLIKCLKNSDIEFELVQLYADGNEVETSTVNGVKQIIIPSPRSATAYNHEYYLRNIGYILKEYIPDDKNKDYIFHLNFITNYKFITWLKKMFKCKIILVCHYTNWSFALLGNIDKLKTIMSGKYGKLNEFEKQIHAGIKEDAKVIRKCDRFVCIAQHTLRDFDSVIGVEREKCMVINNALEDKYRELSPIEREALRKKYYIKAETKIVLFAGRLDEVKGITYLISAFRNVLETNPDSRLIIAGDGDYSHWLADAKDCWTKISFTGKLDKQQLYEFYCMADLGVVCSLHEEFGLVALEMMMHKLPIVVTDTGGLAEIIEDNVSGLKIPIQTDNEKRTIDTDLLANRMLLLMNNDDLANKLGVSARERFIELYEIKQFKEKMLNLYLNV